MPLKLGLQLGYWGAGPRPDFVDMAIEAEALGYDCVFTAEAWGSDVFTPLTWIGAHTSKIRLGTGIAQISARTPAATAMHAMTLDHLSKGRVILGLGVSGPQVVEGWYGQPFAKPLSRTRAYIEIIQKILARREPVTQHSEHYPLPYTGEGEGSSPWRQSSAAAGYRSTTRPTAPRSTPSPWPAARTASKSPTAPGSGSTTTSPRPCCRSSSPSPSTSAAWAPRSAIFTAN